MALLEQRTRNFILIFHFCELFALAFRLNTIYLWFYFPFQNDFNTGLDLSEARASLLSGDVVELTNATSTDSTSMKLVWEVSIQQKYESDFLALKTLCNKQKQSAKKSSSQPE